MTQEKNFQSFQENQENIKQELFVKNLQLLYFFSNNYFHPSGIRK